jgi:glycosyltransferase involved in cell wall biosynthesis
MIRNSCDNRIKIAVDLTPMLPAGKNGGVKPAIFEFIKGLQQLKGPNFNFLFLTAESTHAEVQAITTQHDQALCMDAERTSKAQRPDFFRRQRVDLLYAPFGIISYPQCGIPIVAMVVDLLHKDYPFSIDERERKWRESYFQRMIAHSDRFQVISDYTGERLILHYQVPPEKIFRTYLPIQSRLRPSRSRPSEGDRYFFYPANFWPHKNHEILLVAYRIYQRKAGGGAWKLVLTGSDHPRKEALQQLAISLGIQGYTIFKDYVSETELAELFSSASALVFPSLHEGFGIPTLEAMMLGVPVVASDCGSLPEVVGSAALKVNPRKPLRLASAMYRIATSETLRQALRQRGLERVRDFSLEAEVAALGQKFVEVIEEWKSQTQAPFYSWLSARLRKLLPD